VLALGDAQPARGGRQRGDEAEDRDEEVHGGEEMKR
jgi:hypothetical protein